MFLALSFVVLGGFPRLDTCCKQKAPEPGGGGIRL